MKTVGIMTWFHYRNFGTALQVTALYDTIQRLGYAPQVIRYIPQAPVPAPGMRDFARKARRYIRATLTGTRVARLSPEAEAAYGRFLGRLSYSGAAGSREERERLRYDAYVCGSDQIWSPACYDGAYFLDFVREDARKIAYAPSIGLPSIEDARVREEMRKAIQRIPHLSIRERTGAEIVYRLCGRRAEVVLDPALLLNAARWDELAGTAGPPEGDYILCYFLGVNRRTWRQVEATRRALGLPVKVIPVFTGDYRRRAPACTPQRDMGPAEFVRLLRGAAYICTDSFHGTAFSLVYKRPFSVFERFAADSPLNQNPRIYNILSVTGLEERLVKTDADAGVCARPVDYDAVDERLEKERVVSLAYLKNALAAATEGK